MTAVMRLFGIVSPTSVALKFTQEALQCNPHDALQEHPSFPVLADMEEKLIKLLMVRAV